MVASSSLTSVWQNQRKNVRRFRAKTPVRGLHTELLGRWLAAVQLLAIRLGVVLGHMLRNVGRQILQHQEIGLREPGVEDDVLHRQAPRSLKKLPMLKQEARCVGRRAGGGCTTRFEAGYVLEG